MRLPNRPNRTTQFYDTQRGNYDGKRRDGACVVSGIINSSLLAGAIVVVYTDDVKPHNTREWVENYYSLGSLRGLRARE